MAWQKIGRKVEKLTRSLHLQFQERVYVSGEEASFWILPIVLGPAVIVPNFEDLLQMVAKLQRFVDFKCCPNSSQGVVLLFVLTVLKSHEVCDAELQKDSKLYLFVAFIRTGCAQREGQFPLGAVGEQGDEQVLGGITRQ